LGFDTLAWPTHRPSERVEALVLRGIFLLTRPPSCTGSTGRGLDDVPDAWERFLAPIPPEERGDLISA